MIERIIYDYMLEAFQGSGIGVYMQIPDPDPVPGDNPGPFIVIEKTGSSMENWICESTIAIQSYADSLYNAAELNAQVINAMLTGAVTLDEITRVDLNSDYNFTDTETKRPRYQAVFDVTHYYTN